MNLATCFLCFVSRKWCHSPWCRFRNCSSLPLSKHRDSLFFPYPRKEAATKSHATFHAFLTTSPLFPLTAHFSSCVRIYITLVRGRSGVSSYLGDMACMHYDRYLSSTIFAGCTLPIINNHCNIHNFPRLHFYVNLVYLVQVISSRHAFQHGGDATLNASYKKTHLLFPIKVSCI